MKKTTRVMAVILSLIMMVGMFSSCSKAVESTPVKPEDFRVTAYLVCNDDTDIESLDYSHLAQVTDFILFGAVTFDESGNVKVSENLGRWIEVLKSATKEHRGTNFYINILGLSHQSNSDDWNKQMDDLAERHNNAFASGVLEQNIKNVLDEYDVNGVFFDYEYPLKAKYWKAYDNFLVSLDGVLGEDYKIGSSVSAWNLKQSKKAIDVLDLVTIMSYDLWDDNGDHSSIQLAKDDIEKVRKAGYDMSKVDLGVPFYARPTTHEAFWYDYKAYYQNMDAEGFYTDSDNTGLTFKFNTVDMIKEKTDLAIEQGLGGIMIWHYSCDVPRNNDMSLFNAIYETKQQAIINAQNK